MLASKTQVVLSDAANGPVVADADELVRDNAVRPGGLIASKRWPSEPIPSHVDTPRASAGPSGDAVTSSPRQGRVVGARYRLAEAVIAAIVTRKEGRS